MKIISEMVEVHIFKLYRKELKFLLLKRSSEEIYPGLWQMVTGRIKKGESAVDAAIRELREETGLIPHKLWVVPNVNSFYSAAMDAVSLLPVFAVAVENSKVKISKEHEMFKWVGVKKAKSLLAWAGQARSVELIHDYFLRKRKYLNFVEVKLNAGNVDDKLNLS